MKLTEEQREENLACFKQMMETGSREGIELYDSQDRQWIPKECLSVHANAIYRRKPQAKWRPWKNEEVRIGFSVKAKRIESFRGFISAVCGSHVVIGNSNVSLENLFTEYEQLDGAPCGVKEEA